MSAQKSGRPRLPEGEARTVGVTIRVTPRQAAVLAAKAADLGISVPEVVLMLARRGVETWESKYADQLDVVQAVVVPVKATPADTNAQTVPGVVHVPAPAVVSPELQARAETAAAAQKKPHAPRVEPRDRHLHRPGAAVIAERWAQGQRWVTRACAECGEVLSERPA